MGYPLGEIEKCSSDFALGVSDHNGLAAVATFTKRGLQRNLTKQRDAKLARQLLAATRAEDLVALSVITGEPAHVLDDATHGELQLSRGVGRALGDALAARNRGWFAGYSKVNSALQPSTTYTDNTVVSGQTYYYAATSVNSAGQESARSTPPVQAAIP